MLTRRVEYVLCCADAAFLRFPDSLFAAVVPMMPPANIFFGASMVCLDFRGKCGAITQHCAMR